MGKILNHPGFRYLLALLVVWVGIFFLMDLLPDASIAITGGKVKGENLLELRRELGLYQLGYKRLGMFWEQLFKGELHSYYSKEPLHAVLAAKLAVSGRLLIMALGSLALLTAGWMAILSKLKSSKWALSLLVGITSSVPLFISLPIILIICGRTNIPPVVGGGLSLAIYPAMLLATNLIDISGHRKAPPAYSILARQCGLQGWPRLAMELRVSSSAVQILLNSIAFFILMGIPVAELMLGLPGAGRWMLESILRIDLPVIYLCATISALLCAGLFFFNEVYSVWAGTEEA